MESQLQLKSRKRGGAKRDPLHLALMIGCTLLLTLAGVLLIMQMHVLGIIVMLLAFAARVIDARR